MFQVFKRTTYSFLDISGSFFHPKTGPFILNGNGVGKLTIQSDSDRTVHEYATDGTVIIKKIPEVGGKIIISCQQTSALHSWLLWAYSIITQVGDDKDWATMLMLIRDIQHGTQYNIKGVSFSAVPEINYGDKGTDVSWSMVYAAMLIFPPIGLLKGVFGK